MPFEAVIFDWGGTLTDLSNVDMADMWNAAARHLAPDRAADMAARLAAVEARSWSRIAVDQRSTRLADLLATASQELGLDVTGAVLEQAASRHLDGWTPHITHQPSAVTVLKELKGSGLRTGLLSNTHWPRSFHRRFLERDGLAELIDAELYTCEMEFTKPHASAFRAALDAVGAGDASRAVFVGDRLYDDISGAHRAGLRTVWIRNQVTPHYDVDPDATIDDLSELPAVIDRL